MVVGRRGGGWEYLKKEELTFEVFQTNFVWYYSYYSPPVWLHSLTSMAFLQVFFFFLNRAVTGTIVDSRYCSVVNLLCLINAHFQGCSCSQYVGWFYHRTQNLYSTNTCIIVTLTLPVQCTYIHAIIVCNFATCCYCA